MNETDFGDKWDISYDPQSQEDTIMIESDNDVVYLSKSDLEEMLGCLIG